MIKIIILTIISLTFYSCAVGPQGQKIGPSINPADRYIWVPADEEDFEIRRLRQVHFDAISKEIETLFLNVEIIAPRETNIREETKEFISRIGTMKLNRADQITNEQKRIDNLSKDLEKVRLSSKQIKRQTVNISLAPIFTKDEYINAFYYFRKGRYTKSADLFKNCLRLNPPNSMIDNILFGLSMSYFRTKNFSKAIELLSRLIKEYPNSNKWFMSHAMLALMHERKGEKSQALYILEKGFKNDPPYFIRSIFNKIINMVQDEPIQATS